MALIRSFVAFALLAVVRGMYTPSQYPQQNYPSNYQSSGSSYASPAVYASDDSSNGVYPCDSSLEGKGYAVAGVCNAYQLCSNGETIYQECSYNQRFDEYANMCVDDNSCNANNNYQAVSNYQAPSPSSYYPVKNSNYQTSTYQSNNNYQPSNYQSNNNYQPSNYQSNNNYQPSTYQSNNNNYQPSNYQSNNNNYQPSNYQSNNNYQPSNYQSNNNYQPGTYQSNNNYQPGTYQSNNNYPSGKYSTNYAATPVDNQYPCNEYLEGKTYAINGACYGYFICLKGESLYRQCKPYERFDSVSYTCVKDDSCLYVPNPVVDSSYPASYPAANQANYPASYPAANQANYPASYPAANQANYPASYPAANQANYPASYPAANQANYPASYPAANQANYPASYPAANKAAYPSQYGATQPYAKNY